MTHNSFKKNIYFKFFLLSFIYFSICYVFKKIVPHDELANSESVFIGISFPLFSIFMGIYATLKIKKIALPSLLWLIYATALELVFDINGFCLVCVFLFVSISCSLGLYYAIKRIISKRYSHTNENIGDNIEPKN